MRFKLTIEPLTQSEKNNLLPINYQYELSSWIYKTINFGNKDFAKWLHDCGYALENKQFKLFTFSNLFIPHVKRIDDRLIIPSGEIHLQVSFFPFQIPEYFITGLFKNQTFSLGDIKSNVNFQIRSVEKLPEPDFKEEMKFRLLSPLVLSYKDNTDQKHATYKSPADKNYTELLFKNLIEKYKKYN